MLHSHPHLLEPSILSPKDLDIFQTSDACNDLFGFICNLNESVLNKPTSTPSVPSKNVNELCLLLDKCKELTAAYPPMETASRFGNPAFRTWLDNLPNIINGFQSLFTGEFASEAKEYLISSFGSHKRIDYGTGHEAHFAAFLLVLKKCNVLHEYDYTDLILLVFIRYLKVMRSLQFTYLLEPAGSHGVWGLDDYHFLPFLYGSAQLADHKHLRPKSIHDNDILLEFHTDFMYFECVQFVNQVKSASLKWHSPMLNDISGAKSWRKINDGMIKMYKDQVLGKLPIMQHFLFGKCLCFESAETEEAWRGVDECGHVFAKGQAFPECCGIKVPSAIAATQKKGMRKILPFD